MSHSTSEDSERTTQLRHLNKAVCRSLFGKLDHEELSKDMKTQLKEIKNSHCQRWNFDFENHSPLTGNYVWEALDSRDLPSFYWESPASVPTTESEGDTETLESGGRAKKNGKSPRKSEVKAGVRSRKRESTTPITDFFPRRKRIVSSKSLIPGETTPRKRFR
ncbi:cyclin-dependent kinase inhibitor 1B-like [Chiloscyllium plagiosum]|uniref:cyclin-dependent kinase inhibitor 1B-like n=1 Tax=Chiloscyllium plagiosum TaxID=36176 RepID=UPI001CB8049F|nr:cyclin-dependent kinase inhibitor 1B-like [Chiloscyllium plagiosum]